MRDGVQALAVKLIGGHMADQWYEDVTDSADMAIVERDQDRMRQVEEMTSD